LSELTLDAYSRLFPETPKGRVNFDADPEYLYFRGSAAKIADTLGAETKIIILLRNPVDRAYSQYWMSVRRGFETEDFETAFRLEAERLREGGRHAHLHLGYFSRGFYSEQVEEYLDTFGRNNVRIVLFDELVSESVATLQGLCHFLKIDDRWATRVTLPRANVGSLPRSRLLAKLHGQPMAVKSVLKRLIPSRRIRWAFYPILERLNSAGARPPPMDDEFRRELVGYYAAEIDRLVDLLGVSLDHWRG
jgi:hypothetical protein